MANTNWTDKFLQSPNKQMGGSEKMGEGPYGGTAWSNVTPS